MKKLLAILLLLSTSPIFSQNHLIGLQSGVSWINVNSSENNDLYKARLGAMFGFNYQYQFKNKLQLGVDVLYAQKRQVVKGQYTHNSFPPNQRGFIYNPNPTRQDGDIVQYKQDEQYNYLSMPLKLGYSIGNKLRGFMNVGLVPSLILSSKYTYTENGGPRTETFVVGTYSEESLDIAGIVELGSSYTIKQQYVMFLLCNFQSSANYAWQFEQYLDFTAAVGFRYKFIKE